MRSWPGTVQRYLLRRGVRGRELAWLKVDGRDRVARLGGNLESFDLQTAVCGQSVGEILPVLDGLLPLQAGELVLPQVQWADRAPVEVHIFRKRGRFWVVLLGSGEDERLLGVMHQRINEDSLMRERQTCIMRQYLGEGILEELSRTRRSGDEVQRREVSVLFADLRGFTSYSEQAAPPEVFQALNQYLDVMINPLLTEGAVVDNIMGDEVMGVFGILGATVSPPHQAIMAAFRIGEELVALNSVRRRQGLPVLEAGIGISSGAVMLGAIGTRARKTFTVVGRKVNLAARLQEQARSGEILIDADTYAQIVAYQQGFSERQCTFKGFHDPVQVYSCGAEPRD